MRPRSWMKAAGLVSAAAFLMVIIAVAGTMAFIYFNTAGGRSWSVPISELSASLTWEDGGYCFSGEALLEEERWAMLIDEGGHVVWSLRKPEDVPETYSLTDAASFTRWYLNDYPVQCHVRDDGLMVVGSPKGSVWKHDIAFHMDVMLQIPIWFAGMFLGALGCVLGMAFVVLRRWFRQDQQVRDAARSNWINGISHDIRTPLSMVMGYAAQMELDPALSPERRKQAAVIRHQSQAIRDLVNDLNLTMRLDSEMQALRKESIQPEAFLRQTAADFFNSGMAEGFPVNVELPEAALPALEADGFLLKRAVNNLLTNCVRHNAPGTPIHLGVGAESGSIVFWVESGSAVAGTAKAAQQLETDGGIAHGTGLKLVSQIAAAHGGRAKFSKGEVFRCEVWLPEMGR